MKDHSGHSPLYWAAACGRVGVVKILLEPNDRGIPTPEQEEEQPTPQILSEALLPLHAASCVGCAEVCQLLLGSEAEVSTTTTPLGPQYMILADSYLPDCSPTSIAL